MAKLISQERLKELFDYDDSGCFIEKTYRGKNGHVQIGQYCVGMMHNKGTNKTKYRRVNVDGQLYYLHRLIFVWHHGFWPEQVDHIDGNSINNAIGNLRASTNALNMANIKAKSSTGFKGVSKNGKTYAAKITFEKKEIFLGRFVNKEDAARAYDKAAIRLYGAFARPNFTI